MKSPMIDLIAGARPNFMKIAPIIHALDDASTSDPGITYRLVHTGQHYDRAMSAAFFEQLGIPEPDVNLGVGSGSQANQTANVMVRYEELLETERSQLCLVVGDVTSTMACAITAQKLHIPVAHVEGGIRSGDWTMPEEINRLATDAITNWFFTTSSYANENLRRMGVGDDRIFFVGNTMIDTLVANLDRLQPPSFWSGLGLSAKEYLVVTLHRPSNVDGVAQLVSTLQSIARGTRNLPVIFPVHPRTKKTLEQADTLPANIHFVDPQPYLEFNFLVQKAKAVITDSGGITEEATVLNVPCLTMRDTTERPETVAIGTNELIGRDPTALGPHLDRLFAGEWKKGQVPEKWDGQAAQRIVGHLRSLLQLARD